MHDRIEQLPNQPERTHPVVILAGDPFLIVS